MGKMDNIAVPAATEATSPPPVITLHRVLEDREGVVHVRFVGAYYRLRMAFLIFQIAAWAAVLLFHDSILAYIGQQIGKNIRVVGGGVIRGLGW